MSDQNNPVELQSLAAQPPELPAPTGVPTDEVLKAMEKQQRQRIIIIVVIALVFLILTIGSFVLLMNAKPTSVAQMRDVFIIYLAVQSLIIGLALVILLIQLARLINLLENEVTPLLESTNETVNNLRGTATFLSDNLAEPVIKMNETLAGLIKLLSIMGIMRQGKKK